MNAALVLATQVGDDFLLWVLRILLGTGVFAIFCALCGIGGR